MSKTVSVRSINVLRVLHMLWIIHERPTCSECSKNIILIFYTLLMEYKCHVTFCMVLELTEHIKNSATHLS